MIEEYYRNYSKPTDGAPALRSTRIAVAAVEVVMPSRAERHIELLKLSRPLHRYARTLQSDANASFLLVHQALSRAFAEEDGGLRPSLGLEESLRVDMAGGIQAAHVCA